MDRPFPPVPGVEHRFVDAGGLRTHIATAGRGEPLLLVHGWPQHWYLWRELIGPLADRYRVICPDLRGFGWTDAPGHGYDPETFAEDLVALLDALEIPNARLLAHDWGGYAGWFLCCRHPERIERYLALNIVHPFIRPGLRSAGALWRFWYQAVLAAPGLGGLALRTLARPHNPVRRWVEGELRWAPDALESFAAQFREPARARAATALYRGALLREAPRAVLGRHRQLRLETPTLLLFGVDDHAQSPALLPGFERQAPRMRLELVEATGHFIVDERPRLVLERALEFFEEDDV